MLIFDEKKYAQEIINSKKYNTIKTQGRERCVIVRYLMNLNKTSEEIKDILFSIPMKGGEYLTEHDKSCIYDKIIDKANQFDFITGLQVEIYKNELDVILSVENENARNLLFVYLVYYKWACQIKHLRFYSKKNNVFMAVENNADIWKLANLSKFRVSERYLLCNQLFSLGLYRVDNFKSHNYIYLPFVQNDGEVAITIKDFDNFLNELFIYEYPNQYKRCIICGKVIKKTRSPKKYCSDCAYKENIRKTIENKRSLKTQTQQSSI